MEKTLQGDFDVLDAAISALELDNFTLTRKAITAKHVLYVVVFASKHGVMGLGSIAIRKLADQKVLVSFRASPETPREREQDEVMLLSSLFDLSTVDLYSEPRDSGHFAVVPDSRRKMAEKFVRARDTGRVQNMESWCRTNLGVSAKTIRRYLDEFGLPRTRPHLKAQSAY